ncbi:hypothetical protein TUZN_1559 [Thermoproteus uzoniensis 768-20]|uniref:GIY-YIG domain-containing protein n=1 Tax=Thermoproteus uzoniensis (strain 768-20) TaxID=999630 RepID=F2L2H9_THEU7|nr:hypothetical protein [Thermoproteus uzoniensis]AEA13027.1 hypothetical protein TUZN_1559 [Thermoproteus uzoniensis 768-20]
MPQLALSLVVDVAVIHYVYLAMAGGRAAYVGVGKRSGYYDRVYMHLRGHSSAAKRGLKADMFIILAYTHNRRLAEMWEAWLYAVYKPPYNRRRPSARPRKPPVFPRARCAKKPVEEPAVAAKYAHVYSPLADASTRLAETISGCLENGSNPEAYVDRPPPDQKARRVDYQFHVKR